MATIVKAKTRKCTICDQSKTIDNFFVRKRGFAATTCKKCEEARFEFYREKYGIHIAFFLACAAFDVPFLPLVFRENPTFLEAKKPWIAYNELPRTGGGFEKDGKVLTFMDGETDLFSVFGDDVKEENFAVYAKAEQEALDKRPESVMYYDALMNGISSESLPHAEYAPAPAQEQAEQVPTEEYGTPEQRERWGTADGYTSAEYDALDKMYENRAANFKGQTINDQMEYTLKEVAKWQLLADNLRRSGDVKGATDALKAVDNLLASECLRKKDEKPIEKSRADAMTVALENMGFMEDGSLLTYDELIEAMRDKFIKNKKYDYSLDTADQCILSILNTIRRNADMEKLFTLSADETVDDEYGEFEEEETEEEQKRKRYAGMSAIDEGEEDV